DVALRISQAVQANLSPEERQRLRKRPTENLEAYELYLKSREIPMGDPENNGAGMKLLEQAIGLDPRFAVAKAALAYRKFLLSDLVGDREGVDRAVALATEAAQIDPMLANAPFVLATVYSSKGKDAQAR